MIIPFALESGSALNSGFNGGEVSGLIMQCICACGGIGLVVASVRAQG